MLIYLVTVNPFEENMSNLINIYNEGVLVLTFISVLIMNVADFSEFVVRVWGWILIVLILLSLLTTWLITIPPTVKLIV